VSGGRAPEITPALGRWTGGVLWPGVRLGFGRLQQAPQVSRSLCRNSFYFPSVCELALREEEAGRLRLDLREGKQSVSRWLETAAGCHRRRQGAVG